MPTTLYSIARSNRKNPRVLWQSAVLIGLIVAVGYLMSTALFRDVEESGQASFLAGTLDLEVEVRNSQTEVMQIEAFGAPGVVADTKRWRVRNVGSLDGELQVSLANIINTELACHEPESLVDNSCDGVIGQPDTGELGAVLVGQIILDDDDGARTVASATLDSAQSEAYQAQWQSNLGQYVLPAGEAVDIILEWEIGEAGYTNAVQSDLVQFDLVFDLEQLISP